MIKFSKQYKLFVLLSIIIIVTSAFLRFYKLDWAHGLFTHPDEYHIAASVNQLSFPTQMHPHFFSYGTVTIYLIYFTQEIIKSFSSIYNSDSVMHNLILNSFLIGRFYSALFSVLTIFVVYGISRTFLRTKLSLLAAFLVALTPGLIQQAHFATPESTLTFFLFGSLLFMLKFIQHNKIFYLTLASIFLGLSLGVKISSIVFLLPLILSIILGVYLKNHSVVIARTDEQSEEFACERSKTSVCDEAISTERLPHQSADWFAMTEKKLIFKRAFRFFRKPFRLIMLTLASLILTIITFRLVAPYVFLDFPAFRSNLEYEGGLAIGKIPVFYTRQFIDTIPIVFQTEKIFPYTLGPSLLVFGILGFVYLVISVIKNFYSSSNSVKLTESKNISYETMEQFNNDRSRKSRTINNAVHTIIIVAFLSLFLPSAFLFAKWTRFIAPTFPFFAIFAVFFLQQLKKFRIIFYSFTAILLLATALWTIAFFSIYTNRDIRITASAWLEMHAKPGSSFLVEGGNMIDIPLAGNFQRTSLSFYNLEDDPLTREKIVDSLYSSDYFLVQSRRVFMNHQKLPNMFPKTAKLYDKLFNGELGFKQIKEFHSYPKLSFFGLNMEIPDEAAEETWSVFDHPVIRIFKKNVQLSRERYARFLEL